MGNCVSRPTRETSATTTAQNQDGESRQGNAQAQSFAQGSMNQSPHHGHHQDQDAATEEVEPGEADDQEPHPEGVEDTASSRAPQPSRAVQLVGRSEDGKFFVGPDALKVLEKELADSYVAVAAVAGQARQGKSSLLNRISSQLEGTYTRPFEVGDDQRSVTRGLFMSPTPIKVRGKKHPILLIDCEGIGSGHSQDGSDASITVIYALALVISSLFMPNTMGLIDENSIKALANAVEVTQHIADNNDNEASATHSSDLLKTFGEQWGAELRWLIRDYQEKDDAPTASKELENCLTPSTDENKERPRSIIRRIFPRRSAHGIPRPAMNTRGLNERKPKELDKDFQKNVATLAEDLKENLLPKEVPGGSQLTGSDLASILQRCTEAFNNDEVLSLDVISSMTNSYAESRCKKAKDDASDKYKREMRSLLEQRRGPTAAHNDARDTALQYFHQQCGSVKEEVKRKYLEELEQDMNEVFFTLQSENGRMQNERQRMQAENERLQNERMENERRYFENVCQRMQEENDRLRNQLTNVYNWYPASPVQQPAIPMQAPTHSPPIPPGTPQRGGGTPLETMDQIGPRRARNLENMGITCAEDLHAMPPQAARQTLARAARMGPDTIPVQQMMNSLQ